MDTILPRKYNNPVVIGLAVSLVVAIGVAIYLYMREPVPVQQRQNVPHAHAPKPEHVETQVMDVTNKPALIMFWADWCGWSQKVKPTWDKVATILNNDGSIEAGAIESTKNAVEFEKAKASIPNFPGFPNIRFYPNGYGEGKPSIEYNGDRSEEDILKFAYQSYKK